MTVRDDQTPIAGARIEVFATVLLPQRQGRDRYKCDAAPLHVGATDDNGRWEARGLKPGTYRAQVRAIVEMEPQDLEVAECGCAEACFDVGLRARIVVVNCRAPATPDPCADVLTAEAGEPIRLEWVTARGVDAAFLSDVVLEFTSDRGVFLTTDPHPVFRSIQRRLAAEQRRVVLNTAGLEGLVSVAATLSEAGSGARMTVRSAVSIAPQRTQAIAGNVAVTMRRTATRFTADLPLWLVIRRSTEGLSFANYRRFIDFVLCNQPLSEEEESEFDGRRFQAGANRFLHDLRHRRFLPFTDVDAYRFLKIATEAFVMVHCGVAGPPLSCLRFSRGDLEDLNDRVGLDGGTAGLNLAWNNYLKTVNGTADKTIPYLALIRQKLKDVGLKDAVFPIQGLDLHLPQDCFGILREKLTNPCLLELLWSYWHEEGMLVQTINAISFRFQNRRLSERDPLANLEIDPLRPLNNLLWGYIQDEQHRLTLQRRAYEYLHHYGLRLEGRAVPEVRPADVRSKFIEAFHNLLHLASVFFRQDDDTTFIADGFPVLNALKEVHRIVAEGAHNQFGDLPSTARIEMLMQQWLLSRPEFREYLPTRIMVAYEEPWMDRVDAMKKLQGWTDTSVADFHELAVFGEQILLSIRYGSWSSVDDRESAANWARYWRSEIQGYIHSYRAVTGVDLTAEFTETRLSREAYLPPSTHLRRRLESQRESLRPERASFPGGAGGERAPLTGRGREVLPRERG